MLATFVCSHWWPAVAALQTSWPEIWLLWDTSVLSRPEIWLLWIRLGASPLATRAVLACSHWCSAVAALQTPLALLPPPPAAPPAALSRPEIWLLWVRLGASPPATRAVLACLHWCWGGAGLQTPGALLPPPPAVPPMTLS